MEINSDTYFISQRVREIDKDYFIKWNGAKNRFEIHHRQSRPDTFCLAVPYDRLDERTLDYIHKTKIQNIDKILQEIDNKNARLEAAKVRRIIAQTKERFDETKRNLKRCNAVYW